MELKTQGNVSTQVSNMVQSMCSCLRSTRTLPTDKLLDKGVPERWQNACVWLEGIWHTQDQNLVRTDDHSDALDIHHKSLFSDEDSRWIRDRCL